MTVIQPRYQTILTALGKYTVIPKLDIKPTGDKIMLEIIGLATLIIIAFVMFGPEIIWLLWTLLKVLALFVAVTFIFIIANY